MHILDLQLVTADLAKQHTFYAEVLGLPVVEATAKHATFQVGTSRLTFTQVTGERPGAYHFAFNIPENQLDAGVRWLTSRVPLAVNSEGTDYFASENWNAHMVYFYDPAGNILELIARHDLPNASDQPFESTSLLNISEIGIATDDVDAQIATIQQEVAAPVYRGPGSDTFCPIGDENGLFIVVRRGRIWFPETGKPADHVPITVIVDDGQRPPTTVHFD